MDFIISDLHGNINIYNSIINYLNNLSDIYDGEITLYINGDLIDRGLSSAKMLIDVKNRIQYGGKFKIEYLAGNHELMMYQALSKMRDNVLPTGGNWLSFNGGKVTLYGLTKLIDFNELKEIVDFISNLNIYHRFVDTIDGKNIVLVHAKCPNVVLYDCHLKVKVNSFEVNECLWSREDDYDLIKKKIGNENFFTIIGHTPVDDKMGFIYNKRKNYLNIDGGCAPYVLGYEGYDHSPLVEIGNNQLNILTFNNNNEIIYGNYFRNKKVIPMDKEELEFKKRLLIK